MDWSSRFGCYHDVYYLEGTFYLQVEISTLRLYSAKASVVQPSQEIHGVGKIFAGRGQQTCGGKTNSPGTDQLQLYSAKPKQPSSSSETYQLHKSICPLPQKKIYPEEAREAGKPVEWSFREASGELGGLKADVKPQPS